MRRPKHFLLLAFLALVFASAACSLILDTDKEQCSTDGDCAKFAAGAVCRDSICVGPNGPDSSTPVDEGGTDGGTNDAKADAPFGQDGCFPGTPTTTNEFLNACTTSQCVPFDNCAKLGICDGGLPGTNPPDGGGSTAASDAGSPATQNCTDVAAAATCNGGPCSPVYITGSSNFPPFLKSFAPVLAKSGYAAVWQTSNSCEGVNVIFNAVDATKRVMKERPGRITEFYGPDGNVTQCLLQGDVTPDIGESDIYAKTCQQNIGYDPTEPSVAAAVGEYLGPTMAMVFIQPATSTQQVISAEAAQAVFGRGTVPDTVKLPWDDPVQMFIRASSTATNQIMSKGIFVDPTKWWGVDKRTASNMALQMKQVPQNLAEKTIGIISNDFADQERGNIKTLAFQARDQTCGFWPDSTPFTKDKINVRDGHYPLWGPLHFFARLSNGIPGTAAGGAFVSGFSEAKLDADLVKSIVESSNIPACAMKVSRTEEMGPIKAFDPPFHCYCYFDSIAKGSSSCTKCAGPQDCPSTAPACNYGFCETR